MGGGRLLKNQQFQIPVRIGVVDQELISECAVTSKSFFIRSFIFNYYFLKAQVKLNES